MILNFLRSRESFQYIQTHPAIPPRGDILTGANMKTRIFKFINNEKILFTEYEAMSDEHALTIAEQLYDKHGLIGRYYGETESGYLFYINK